jgi:hypothetical protein
VRDHRGQYIQNRVREEKASVTESKKKSLDAMDWIHLAQDKEKGRSLVNKA